MSDITTLLSTDDIVVLGPPTIVNVQTDIGPTGDRGNKVFVGLGHPNTSGINEQESIILNDIYINNLIGSNYSYMYQYVSQPAGNTWVPVLRLNPSLYSAINSTSFNDGTASIVVPISFITDANISSLVEENFAIQVTPIHTNPTAISVTSVEIGGIDNAELTINLSALEQSGGTWQNLDGLVSINLFITVVSL